MSPPGAALELLGVPREGWTPLAGGMNAVWRSGDHVLKRVVEPAEAAAERAMLGAVRLPVPVPALLGAAEHAGATWLLISWLPGERLSHVWDQLDDAARSAVAETLGGALAGLWATPVVGLRDASLAMADRPAQVEAAVQRQLGFGLDPIHIDDLRALANAAPLDDERVATHADLHRDQVLLGRGPLGWQVTGLLDFGDAVRAPRHYDLVSPFCSLLGPDPRLREALVDAAGLGVDVDWMSRMLALTMLHPWIGLAQVMGAGARLPSLASWLSVRPNRHRGPA